MQVAKVGEREITSKQPAFALACSMRDSATVRLIDRPDVASISQAQRRVPAIAGDFVNTLEVPGKIGGSETDVQRFTFHTFPRREVEVVGTRSTVQHTGQGCVSLNQKLIAAVATGQVLNIREGRYQRRRISGLALTKLPDDRPTAVLTIQRPTYCVANIADRPELIVTFTTLNVGDGAAHLNGENVLLASTHQGRHTGKVHHILSGTRFKVPLNTTAAGTDHRPGIVLIPAGQCVSTRTFQSLNTRESDIRGCF